MSKTWFNMTAAELGREIEGGRINPVTLTEAFFEKIAGHVHAERIYARLTEGRARAEAMAAAQRARSGFRKGPLDGVPVSWKDLFDTAGVATEAGSALLKDRIPQKDAEVLQVATLSGLVCLGKTHMSELAFSGLGLNPVTATPPCLNDEAAVPGGSSSGAAASVAFGLAPAAIGSDTGGSVRVPSAWNDLIGLKTTHGRMSLRGTVPLCETLDTVGPLAHSVEDCALLLAALEGGRPVDLAGVDLSGKRFAVLKTVALEDLRERPALGFEDALSRLARAGAQIVEVDFPRLPEAFAAAGPVFAGEAYGIWRETIESAPDKMFRPILERFRAGGAVMAVDYVAAWRKLHELRALWNQEMAQYDAVLVPTSPILPPNAERLLSDNDYYVTENLLALRNTRITNLMGGCALTLPTSQPSCGISLIAGPMAEERLLQIGAAADRALG